MRQATLLASLAAVLVCASAAAPAQDTQGTEDDELGGTRTRLSLKSGAFYTDNFYNQPTTATDTIGGIVSPELRIVAQTRKLDFNTTLDAEYGAFDLPTSQDDYLDGSIVARLGLQATVRNHIRLGAGYKHGHDPFGIDRTEDISQAARNQDLDEWDRTTGGLHYRYGAAGAKMNAEVGVSTMQKEYTTNRESGGVPVTRTLDHDSTTGEYTLFYNYSPKTAALVDFSRTDINFDEAFGGVDNRSGQIYRARLGVRWLATGKTSGDVRVGYRRRIFDDGSSDIETPDWEAGVDWAPVPRSTLRLTTAHSEQPSYRADTRVIEVDSIGITSRHNFSARLRSTVAVEALKVEFDPVISTANPREDDIFSASAGAEYLAMSYLWVVGSVGINQRDSTLANREYDRLNAFIGIRLGR